MLKLIPGECVLLLADFSLKGVEALQAGNRSVEGISLYYGPGEERIFIIVSRCTDLPEGHGMDVSRISLIEYDVGRAGDCY